MSRKPHLLGCALTLVLAACAGGGGGGGGGGGVADIPAAPSAPVAFTSFNAVQPGQTVVLGGAVSQTSAVGTDPSQAVTSITTGPVESTAKISLSYDANQSLSAIKIENSQSGTLSFSKAAGDTISCSSGACSAHSGGNEAVLVDNKAFNWNYQTFGMWASDAGGSALTTFFSAGSPTPGSAVPTTGSAIFAGSAVGVYIDSAGVIAGTGASMTANVNFQNRSIAFATSGTATIINNLATPQPGLNLSGTLTYAPGSGQFSGALNTANGAMSGSTTGQFYGPNAEEIGGIYNLSGSGVSRMLGGYGGKR